MNKAEYISAVAEKSGVSKAEVAKVLAAEIDVIKATTAGGDKITILGFVSYEKEHKVASKGRNPSTGAEVDIPARDKLKVKVLGATHKAFYGEGKQA